MLTDELPNILSCSVSNARGNIAKSHEIAERFISTVIHLTGSVRKASSYRISIDAGSATFTKEP